MTYVILTMGKKSKKLCEEEEVDATPIVLVTRNAPMYARVAVLVEGAENSCYLSSIQEPDSLIRAWRGMHIAHHLSVVTANLVNACWYAAAKGKGPESLLRTLAEEVGGMALRRLQVRLSDAVPESDELEEIVQKLSQENILGFRAELSAAREKRLIETTEKVDQFIEQKCPVLH